MTLFVPPPQPERVDWRYVSDLGDEVNGQLCRFAENIDRQLQMLFERPTIAIDDSATASSSSSSSSGVSSVVNDTNVTGSIAGTVLTLGWTGTLAAARLNANVVQSIVNDTNITGSIAAQVLTLAWSGTLAAGRGGTGQSAYTAGDILYASGAAALSKLAKGTATQVLHSGTTPSWSAVDLAADVTGNLAVTHLNSGSGATASTFWSGDGTWKSLSSTLVGSDSLTVSRVGTPTGNYQLSTLGTIDWFVPNGALGGHYRNQAFPAPVHSKIKGEGMFLAFDWVSGGRTPTVFTQASGFMTMTTTAADDVATAALAATTAGQGVFENTLANGTVLNWGFRISLPAMPQARKLILEVESFSCSLQLTALVRGQGTLTDTSQAITGTSATARGDVFEIDYQCPTGGMLTVTCLATAVVSAAGNQNPNLKFNWAYITT